MSSTGGTVDDRDDRNRGGDDNSTDERIDDDDGKTGEDDDLDCPSGTERDARVYQPATNLIPVVEGTNILADLDNRLCYGSNRNRKLNSRALPPTEQTYKLETFDKNYLLILNQMVFDGHRRPRIGTNKDVDKLIDTFKRFKFVVDVQNDLKRDQIMEKLTELAAVDFTDFGCVAVAVLTHGGRDSLIYARDLKYSEFEIMNCLLASSNPTLLTKPRIVLVQACRGNISPRGVSTGQEVDIERDDEPCELYTLPDEADMLLFHSSYVGKPSFRNINSGSWFIQELCDKIVDLAFNTDLESIFFEVKKEVAIKKWHEEFQASTNQYIAKQMPVSTSTLTRKLYLKRNDEMMESQSDSRLLSSRPATPQLVHGACCCFLDHFDYIKDRLEYFVGQKPEDRLARSLLEVANNIDNDDSTRNVKFSTAKTICNFLRENGRCDLFYDSLYFYVHKEEDS